MKKAFQILKIFFFLPILFYSCHPQIENEMEENEDIDGIERTQYYKMQRGGEIDEAMYHRAQSYFRNTNNYEEPNSRDAGIMGWQNLGPHNVGGRVRGFATHPTNPNILFCGGTSGGLWKSTNGGSSWQIYDNFWTSMAVTSIIVHPTNPDTMYVATGEGLLGGKKQGDGIFKTYNGGATWDNFIAGFHDNSNKQYWVNKLVFHPTDPSYFYAVTSSGTISGTNNNGGGIYRFAIHGINGTLLYQNDANLKDILDIDINPNDPDHIIASGNIGCIYTLDGGTNWTQMSDQIGFLDPGQLNRVEIAFAPSNPNVIYAATQKAQNVYKSVNAGDTWVKINSATYDFYQTSSGGNVGGYASTIWISPYNSDRLIIGGLNLFKSIDGGVTFTQISNKTTHNSSNNSVHADQHIIVQSQDYSSSNRKIFVGSDGGISSASDWSTITTTGWNQLNGNSLGITQFYNSMASPDGTIIIGGTQDNQCRYTTDSGLTWNKIYSGDGGYCAVSQQDNNVMYFSAQKGNFARTLDGGTTVCKIFSFNNSTGNCTPYLTDEGSNFIAPLEINPTNGNQLYVGGKSLFYSGTNGSTWFKVKDSLSTGTHINVIHVSKADPSHVWVGYDDGTICKTETAGTTWTWTDLTANISNSRIITAIETHPLNKDVVMVIKGGYNTSNIWYSGDGGTTFQNRSSGFPSVHASCMGWHPDHPNWCYVGTDLGLMASEDAGQNWNISPLSNGQDGPVNTEITSIFYSNEKMHLGTFGRGIWRSNFSVQEKIYVDNTCITTCGCGTQSCPYLTIAEALAHAGNGSTIVISGGTDYDISSPVIVQKRIKIESTGAAVIIK